MHKIEFVNYFLVQYEDVPEEDSSRLLRSERCLEAKKGGEGLLPFLAVLFAPPAAAAAALPGLMGDIIIIY